MAPIRRVFLIGLMGSGKTTVGRRLSRALGWPYVDNDGLVEAATGRRAPEIIDSDGEDVLHVAEVAAFERALSLPEPIIAGIAGWVVTRADLRERLHSVGLVVWLRAEPSTLLVRAGNGRGRRPEARSLAWIQATADARAAAFEAAAHLVVDVDLVRPAAVVERIRAALREGR